MFSFFKRRKPQGERDLEQVIYDVAEHHREEDRELVYRLMTDREVYLPVVPGTLPAAAVPGVPYVTSATDQLGISLVELPGNGRWAPAMTLRTHPLLVGTCIGMPWQGLLKMVQRLPDARGVVLQGQRSWMVLDQERVAYLLALYGRG